MILLTVVVGWLSILCSWSSIQERVKEYYAFFLFLQAGMLGVFMVLDVFLFYVFWEIMLVPMYFIIGIWGGGRRLYAAIKFFLYTLAGSVLMLLGMLKVYFDHFEQFGHYSFALEDLMRVAAYTGPDTQFWLFWAFFVALRREGADVPVPHVASRRSYRGADGGLRHSGRHSLEDGPVRLGAICHAAIP